MEKIAVINGLGPNSVEIISMVFPNFDAAFKYAEKMLGSPERQGVQKGNRVADFDFSDIGDDDEKAENFFTSYYGGCGDCHTIRVMEVDFGKPLVGFDLD